MPDVALLIDWENVYYTLRQHTTGPLPSSLAILQAILKKAAEFGPVRVKLAIFGQEVAAQDDTLLMALEFTGIEPIAVAQRMSGRILKGRSDAVLITRAMKLLYKERPELQAWFIVSGDRDLNALCKALKDEDKNVYLVAGDLSLANELRDSPYLRDEVFLLEDLIPEARWTRTGQLRTDDTQADKVAHVGTNGVMVPAPLRRTRGGRGRGGGGARAAAARPAPTVPAVVPTGEPESEKEQRRLAVLLLDQLVSLKVESMPRGDFVQSVVPLSEKEASSVLEQRIDAAIEQGHITGTMPARSRAKARQLLAPNFASPLVAETFFHLIRIIRRIDTVTSKDTRRVPAVEAVLDPLSRADQPGGIAKGRTARRILLETLFNIAEERGVIATEQVTKDDRQITMCWLQEEHPLAAYARRPGAGIVHLFNFVSTAKTDPDAPDWVNTALFSELLARVEGDRLDASIRAAAERGVIRSEDHGKKAGYLLDRTTAESRAILGAFSALEGGPLPALPLPGVPAPTVREGSVSAPAAAKRPTRRGSRGGRGRRGGRAHRRVGEPPADTAAE
ncbi:MAG TPA: NYN domain-containing protein [Candidatus Limnocylindria bacterium]|nr:NYN domain-containing protein [Candidatus Limnocylindria bacterium]